MAWVGNFAYTRNMEGVFEMNAVERVFLLCFLCFVFVLLCVALHFKPAIGAIGAIKDLIRNKKALGEA